MEKRKIKKHLDNGSLRKVMADEIQRVIKKYAGQTMAVEQAAIELGVTPRTLRIWRGPVDKGGWPELQIKDVIGKFLDIAERLPPSEKKLHLKGKNGKGK